MKTLIINIKELLQVRDSSILKVCSDEMEVLPTIKNAYLVIEDHLIADFGSMEDLPEDLNPEKCIDANGKIVMNWIISCLIYGIVSGILCLIGIGVVLLIALAICNLTFIIIGSVKASQGNLWPYPLSIPFIK